MSALTREQLQRFCATSNDIRVCLQQPSTIGPFTYATDGHVAVRVDAIDLDEPSQFGPSIIDTIDREVLDYGLHFIPLVMPPEPRRAKCEHCEAGRVRRCPECDGQGERECDMGHYHDCDACDGDGQVAGDGEACHHCDGTGKDKGSTLDIAVALGGGVFSWDLLNRFADLPGVEIAWRGPPAGSSSCGGDNCGRAVVRFEGGRGVVMGLRWDWPDPPPKMRLDPKPEAA